MKPNEYLQCLEFIAERDSLSKSHLHPVPASDILAVEEELGNGFPEIYEEFLTTVGVGCEFGGVAWWYHLDITRPGNILTVKQHLAREQAQMLRSNGRKVNEFPDGFLPIYDSCDGAIYGYIPAKDKMLYDRRIWVWDTEDLTLEQVADDLCSFFDYLLEDEKVDALVGSRRL